MKPETIKKMSTEKLIEKLEQNDNKYRDAVTTKRSCETWGYGMRAYHGLKTMSFKKQDTARDNCNMIKRELKERGVNAITIWA